MAVSYVDQANTGADTQASSQSVTKPAAAAANDVGVFFLVRWASSNTFPAVTPPTGAVLRNTQVSGAGGSWEETLTYLIYVDAQSSFTFSWTGGAWSSLGAVFFTGVDQTLDLATVPHNVATGSGTSVPSTSVTTVAGAGLAWNANTQAYTAASTHTPPTGYTEVHDVDPYASAYKIATGTSETASGATVSSSQAHIIANLVALAPAAGGGGSVSGTAVASLGSLTATATGLVTGQATANATLGALTATISGSVSVTGTAAASLGGLSATAGAGGLFVTSISGTGTGQHFLDQNGDPILIKGDVIWAFPVNAGRWNGGDWQGDFTSYLDIRQGQGFNLLMIGALGSTQNGGPSDTGETFDGILPFNGGFGTLTEAYWARVDFLVSEAAKRGITVLINVAYSYDMDTGALSTATATDFTSYGNALGARYASEPNIMWGAGGDYFDNKITHLGNLFAAIAAQGDTHLVSIQNYPESTSRRDLSNNNALTTGANNSDINFVYSYNVTYDGVHHAYTETSPICTIWGDGHFDQNSTADRKVMRDLTWWALSAGARGHIYGGEGTWSWTSSSLTNASTWTFPGDLAGIWAILEGLNNWHQLVPDTDDSFVTAGRGTHAASFASGGSGGVYDAADPQDQYVTASITPDGSLAVVYFPVDATITVSDTELQAGYTVTWIDPTNGATTAETPSATYSPTGTNSLGSSDWLLVFEASGTASANLGGLTATASATVSHTATAQVTLGSLTATVTGTVEHIGAATASLGALTASASGTVSGVATASAALGSLTATAIGTVSHIATAVANLGALVATSVQQSGTVGYTIGDDITIGKVNNPTINDLGLSREATGPALARAVTGPEAVDQTLTASKVDNPTVNDLGLSRAITGPSLARTITGPEV